MDVHPPKIWYNRFWPIPISTFRVSIHNHVRDFTIHGQVPEEVSKPYQRAGQFVQVRTIAIWTSFYVILCNFHQDGLEHWNNPSHIFEAPKIVVLLQKIDHKPRASKHVPRSWQWRQLCLSKNPFKQLHVNFTFFYPRCRKLDESTCNNSQPARCHCPLWTSLTNVTVVALFGTATVPRCCTARPKKRRIPRPHFTPSPVHLEDDLTIHW